MNLSISFPSEIERTLERRAAAAGQDVAAFVQQAVKEKLAEDEESELPRKRSKEEFRQWLAELIELFPESDHPIDDSRESIYQGRGE
jgi:hypothetical protein